MELEIRQMGERGQIVIPQEYREKLKLKKGEKFLICEVGNKIILEPTNKMIAKNIERIREDLLDIKIANNYWEKVKKGKINTQTKKEFLEELEKW